VLPGIRPHVPAPLGAGLDRGAAGLTGPDGTGPNGSGHMITGEPPLSEEVARRRRGLRTGWTTGTCASAASKAAAIGHTCGSAPEAVEVGLPGGRRVSFPVEVEATSRCAVVKDAGDDPDCTDGARMTAEVGEGNGATELRAGPGVGVVTLPGLGLPVGAPAITAVPRRMILAALAEVTPAPLTVTFSVPGGEEMAAETTNERLGIVGGISILGTTGIVRPFSTAAYRASVVQQIDVAAAQGQQTVVLATGHRSESAAMRLRPDLPPVCFVEVGDFTGIAVRRAAARHIRDVVFVGMAGKISKLAAGIMMTHFHRSEVSGDLLADAARATGAPAPVVDAATATSTARHFFEVCIEHDCREPLAELCRRAQQACRAHVDDALRVDVVMVDFEGTEVVARA
ncbi:MAG TPA: cobalt-precorrin-5B (C(1))-methyltransferase, partial [Acidimicrobiales bacterium]|nr:cobalt-precorrin-5B (C(1))-methyltransferase [Acidimicrobiales bacterium]